MHRIMRLVHVGLLAGVLAGLAACVTDSKPAGPLIGSAAQSSSGGGGVPVPVGLVDPCSLLTGAEATDIGKSTSQDGVRVPTVDDTYVSCEWYSTDDSLKITPIVSLDLFAVDQGMKDHMQSDVRSGTGEDLVGVGERTVVQAADLGETGNSWAVGWKGSIYYRLDCHPQLNKARHAKAICIDAVTTIVARLP